MQISSSKKTTKNRTKIGFGKVLGSIWEGFGTVLNLFWASWALFGSFFWFSKHQQYHDTAQDGLQRGFWVHFGRDLQGFREDLGGFWESFRKNLRAFWALWTHRGQILDILYMIWPCWGRFYNWTPALVREASQFFGSRDCTALHGRILC